MLTGPCNAKNNNNCQSAYQLISSQSGAKYHRWSQNKQKNVLFAKYKGKNSDIKYNFKSHPSADTV